MEFKITNLGPIRKAEIQLKPLTVFVGENNTGKTYAAYLIYQFFSEKLDHFPVKKKYKQILDMEQFMKKFDMGSMLKNRIFNFEIPIIDLIKNNKSYFEEMLGSRSFKNSLDSKIKNIVEEFPNFIGGEKKNFEGFDLSVNLGDNKIGNNTLKSIQMSSWKNSPFFAFGDRKNGRYMVLLSKEKGSKYAEVTIALMGEFNTEKIDRNDFLENINEVLTKIIFNFLLNHNLPLWPQIFPIQRNTLSIDVVQKAINSFFRDVGLLKQQERQIGPSGLLEIPSFSQPMNNFLRTLDYYSISPEGGNIGDIFHNEEFAKEANNFEKEVLSGKLKFVESKDGKTKTLKFLTKDNQKTLDLIVTSSMVQQLSYLIMYVKKRAQYNHMIIIDEPEANLHPKAQIKFVELLSFLVNHGVWVIITTHTPYIVDYLNNLTMGFEVYKKMKKKKIKGGKFPLNPKILLDPKLVSAYEFKKDGVAKPIMKKNMIEWDTFGAVTEQIEKIYFDLQTIEDKLEEEKRKKT